MSKIETLNVAVTPELASEIEQAVSGGEYSSAGDVIRTALHRWQDERSERRAHIATIRDKLAEAADNPERLSDAQVRRHFEERFKAIRDKKAS